MEKNKTSYLIDALDKNKEFFFGTSGVGHGRADIVEYCENCLAYWEVQGEDTYCSNCGTNVTEGFDTNGFDQVVMKTLPKYCPTCGRFMIF